MTGGGEGFRGSGRWMSVAVVVVAVMKVRMILVMGAEVFRNGDEGDGLDLDVVVAAVVNGGGGLAGRWVGGCTGGSRQGNRQADHLTWIGDARTAGAASNAALN